MAIEALAEFILRPIAELILLTVGYYTARALIPPTTFGRVLVTPILKREIAIKDGRRFARQADGRFALEGELAAYFGILFWALIGTGVLIYIATP